MIVDGPSIEKGVLALGQNLLVAFHVLGRREL
jgi:DNA-directed RNA polymerase beta subunit